MTKREQAINSTELLLQYVLTGQGASIPIGCQFVDADYLAGGLYNALELLKEREAVKPKEVNMYPSGQYACGFCGHISVGSKDYHAKYCPECGRAVKWDD